MSIKSTLHLAKIALALSTVTASMCAFADNAKINFRIVETTDIHSYLTAYDYFKDKPVDNYGLTRAATLVKKAKAEAPQGNVVLVDNGDLIQGSLIGEWANSTQLKNMIHPAYTAMNTMGYDVGNIGNHEFNFGLDYLNRALKGAEFPYVNSNVYDAKTQKNYFTPYIIVDKELTDTEGKKHTVKVGYIGFTPPGIMKWDADKLVGKVTVQGIYDSAKKFIPEMKAKGAEVIVAVPHSGLGKQEILKLQENESALLTTVPGIDAVMFGHSHAVFPSEEFKDVPNSDIAKGTINGVPATMPGRWGDHIGIVDLVLEQQADGKFKRVKGTARTEAIYDPKTKKALVKDDKVVSEALKDVHQSTRDFANSPIGKLSDKLYGYLALTQDDYAVKLVNQAQLDFLKKWVAQNPEYKDYKLVSAAAPFKYGERHNDITNFTSVNDGTFLLRNTADVYVYPNTVSIVKATGREVKEWAECASGMFNTIDPNSTNEQELLNYKYYRTYNFDILYPVTYKFDVTRENRLQSNCKVRKDVYQSRLVDFKLDGKEVKDSDKFLVVTNNYRASGGYFSGTGADHIVYSGTEPNQELISNYVREQTEKHGSVTIDKSINWMIQPIDTNKDLKVVIYTAPDEKATEWVLSNSQYPLTKHNLDDAGFQQYFIDLKKKK